MLAVVSALTVAALALGTPLAANAATQAIQKIALSPTSTTTVTHLTYVDDNATGNFYVTAKWINISASSVKLVSVTATKGAGVSINVNLIAVGTSTNDYGWRWVLSGSGGTWYPQKTFPIYGGKSYVQLRFYFSGATSNQILTVEYQKP
jgi:hypothetical protein